MEEAKRELEKLLADHCAPVFCHRKAANLVAARRELLDALPEVLNGSKISWMKLCSCKNIATFSSMIRSAWSDICREKSIRAS